MGCIALIRCVLVLRCGLAGWCGILMQAEALVLQPASNQSNTTHEITQHISHKLLRMDVLTFEAC